MTVIAWGGDGASVLRLTWLRGRRGHVQGFPCRHYGRCVLDEHIAGEANAQKAKCIEGGAERARTEIAGGVRKPRHVLIIERLGPVPRFPTSLPGGEERSLK